MSSVVLLFSIISQKVSSQSCLTNHPSVSHSAPSANNVVWIEQNGAYHTTIEFDAMRFVADETGSFVSSFFIYNHLFVVIIILARR